MEFGKPKEMRFGDDTDEKIGSFHQLRGKWAKGMSEIGRRKKEKKEQANLFSFFFFFVVGMLLCKKMNGGIHFSVICK